MSGGPAHSAHLRSGDMWTGVLLAVDCVMIRERNPRTCMFNMTLTVVLELLAPSFSLTSFSAKQPHMHREFLAAVWAVL